MTAPYRVVTHSFNFSIRNSHYIYIHFFFFQNYNSKESKTTLKSHVSRYSDDQCRYDFMGAEYVKNAQENISISDFG